MPDVLLATDADWIHETVQAALADDTTTVTRVTAGRDVLPTVQDRDPDLVVLDLQIGNMGGMAACLALRHEEGAGRLDHRPILMLLDRAQDVFLARRSDADGWLVKPLDAFRIRRAADALLAGRAWTEGVAEDAPEVVDAMIPPAEAPTEQPVDEIVDGGEPVTAD